MKNVGQSIEHDAAQGHVTGTAPFLEDLPLPSDALTLGLVYSPVACGKITSLDLSAAKQVPGVAAIYTAADIPGHNYFGPHFRDEPVLADQQVLYVGQPVAVIAAESAHAITLARAQIILNIEAQEPILSIERAIKLERFIGPGRRIARGDTRTAIAAAPRKLAGVFHCGGQEQFYLESQAAIAYPGEQGQVIVHSSTQNPTEVQHVVAEALGVAQHQVVCLCKRMGGGFGGKETQAVLPAVLAALVAQKTGRTARLVLTKDEDMCSTGKRHEYRVEWEVGFDLQGKIEGVRANFFSNGGASADLSLAVLERSLLHFDNSYYLPHVEMVGKVCFTNFPSNTAFRGFGGPQGMIAIENIIHEIARDLNVDPYEVQLNNLYGTEDRNTTPYGQLVRKNHLPEIMSQLAATSQYRERRQAIEAQNKSDVLLLRGIAIMPMKFGISFTTKFLNQGNALVNIYTDGTIQVSTGATEMGQGVNTKIRQLVADEFGIGYDRVLLMPTSTEKNPNTSPTAASASTDLNGTAAVRACETLRGRLAELAAKKLASVELGLTESPECVIFEAGLVFDRRNPAAKLTFGQLCLQARLERIDLGARGFYATPGVDYNRETGRGNPFLYYTMGAAVAEVEIDRFTGSLRVPRVDLLMDIGRSINPAVDRGQIIGGFIQGMGWATAECLVYNERGELLSHSPTTYKIPAITDLPPVLRCDLFENNDNDENVARSKAVGEPPLMLAISVWTAVKQALSQAVETEDLRLPATGEEILRQLYRRANVAKSEIDAVETATNSVAPRAAVMINSPHSN
ncbi:Xanthine dehydrogenase molybdenum-binding subunit [Anatilimnocola aggregata]|uniref:Xanthine dehydrogenase molybdenum-binding subunit n=1 Tax=Anatilimnocola aggregata TaxID=2528021 RepID=A0A517YDF6_9BACT|nr:xanthine dehydrogenase molybdopterin binding subunit [Anatilimnocola aggregata]QDU28275.1 Xanthine dehydrogenase molybdenum-binding subunit [Anatilimnocola aggregata]